MNLRATRRAAETRVPRSDPVPALRPLHPENRSADSRALADAARVLNTSTTSSISTSSNSSGDRSARGGMHRLSASVAEPREGPAAQSGGFLVPMEASPILCVAGFFCILFGCALRRRGAGVRAKRSASLSNAPDAESPKPPLFSVRAMSRPQACARLPDECVVIDTLHATLDGSPSCASPYGTMAVRRGPRSASVSPA